MAAARYENGYWRILETGPLTYDDDILQIFSSRTILSKPTLPILRYCKIRINTYSGIFWSYEGSEIFCANVMSSTCLSVEFTQHKVPSYAEAARVRSGDTFPAFLRQNMRWIWVAKFTLLPFYLRRGKLGERERRLSGFHNRVPLPGTETRSSSS
jgi:hypothetical protein